MNLLHKWYPPSCWIVLIYNNFGVVHYIVIIFFLKLVITRLDRLLRYALQKYNYDDDIPHINPCQPKKNLASGLAETFHQISLSRYIYTYFYYLPPCQACQVVVSI